MTQPTAAEAKLVDKSNNPQVGDQQAAVNVPALATTETAAGAFTTAEIDMLNNLKTDVTNLRASLIDFIEKAGEGHGLTANHTET